MIFFFRKRSIVTEYAFSFFWGKNLCKKKELLYGMVIIRQNLIVEWIPVHELFLNHKIKNLAHPTNKASFWRKDFPHVDPSIIQLIQLF
jgi:hypothetical protein